MNANRFTLLQQKDILAILDGDITLFVEDGREFRMPYLSGPKLVQLSNQLGLPTTYQKSGPSRWMYLHNLVEHCIKQESIQNLLGSIFGKASFAVSLNGVSSTEANRLYNKCIKEALALINGQLFFSNVELAIVGTKFVMRDKAGNVTIETSTIESIDQSYVQNLVKRAMQDIQDGNCDSAITKSRTLLEEVFCYAIELQGEEPSGKGKISVLYKQVKDLYDMHADKNMDVRIKTLLSGLDKIVSSIGDMRNKSSDSHGVGQRRIAIRQHHATLAVNSAATMAEFILAVTENSKA